MNKGKQSCKILKNIRRQIAEANDIEYITSECRYKGNCQGTCPKCEAEIRYLEQQLEQKRMSGKSIALVGISAGIMTMAMAPAQAADMTSQSARQDTAIVAPKINPPIEDEPWEGEVYDTIAEFPGGTEKLMEFLLREIRYPGYPRKKEKIIHNIYIDEDGYIKPENIVSPPMLDKRLADECKRILCAMPRWQPAVMNGKRIKLERWYPISFIIDNEQNEGDKAIEIIPLNETPAEFPGGISALHIFVTQNMNLSNPVPQGKMDMNRMVTVQFTIDEEGNVRHPSILRSQDPVLNKKVFEIIDRMPKWKPATLRGKKIASTVTIPILFPPA